MALCKGSMAEILPVLNPNIKRIQRQRKVNVSVVQNTSGLETVIQRKREQLTQKIPKMTCGHVQMTKTIVAIVIMQGRNQVTLL